MRVAVAGTGRLGAAILNPIVESKRHEAVALIVNGRHMGGVKRGIHKWQGKLLPRKESPLPTALSEGLPILWIDDQSEGELRAIEQTSPDILLTCGFSIILKEPLLSLPKIGCVNVHSSLLPKHRGPSPFSHAILSGDTESGVTFHVTVKGIDSGPILDQTPFPLDATDTALSVYNKSCVVAGERVVAVLDQIEERGLVGRPQEKKDATYDPRIRPANLRLNWARPAEDLFRLYRACMPAQKTYCEHRGTRIRVLRATFDEEPCDATPGTVVRAGAGIRVATGRGTFTILAGLGGRHVSLLWPLPWNRPEEGEVLG